MVKMEHFSFKGNCPGNVMVKERFQKCIATFVM